jgi:UDP-N-acetylglucosamine 2-epimerase (hydrolysing)
MTDRPKKILFVTGTRADFGKIKPLVERLEGNPGFECHLFVTGMHMFSLYGATINEVRKAGFKNIFPFFNHMKSDSHQMDMILANTIHGLGSYIREFPPDMIVVHGDRVEALAGAIVGSLNNILVAHVEGGELSGTVDDLIRHAVSKLSHLHFVANDDARTRLRQMGENPDSIHIIGSPDIDIMLSDRLPRIEEVKAYYEIPFTEYGIFMFHPVTTELTTLQRNVSRVTAALVDSGMDFVVIYPNNDAGYEIILESILGLSGNPRFRIFPSLRFEYFLSLLKHAKVIVGNSSAGIREAPVYGIPTVNIGSRQINRFRYPSILDVPEDEEAILDSLRNLPRAIEPTLYFGYGSSALKFSDIIEREETWRTALQKQFRDLSA